MLNFKFSTPNFSENSRFPPHQREATPFFRPAESDPVRTESIHLGLSNEKKTAGFLVPWSTRCMDACHYSLLGLYSVWYFSLRVPLRVHRTVRKLVTIVGFLEFHLTQMVSFWFYLKLFQMDFLFRSYCANQVMPCQFPTIARTNRLKHSSKGTQTPILPPKHRWRDLFCASRC